MTQTVVFFMKGLQDMFDFIPFCGENFLFAESITFDKINDEVIVSDSHQINLKKFTERAEALGIEWRIRTEL